MSAISYVASSALNLITFLKHNKRDWGITDTGEIAADIPMDTCSIQSVQTQNINCKIQAWVISIDERGFLQTATHAAFRYSWDTSICVSLSVYPSILVFYFCVKHYKKKKHLDFKTLK